jgi:hypothetical protein
VSGEGVTNTEQLLIQLDGTIARPGFGEMKKDGDMYVYADPGNLSYNINLEQTDCDDPALTKTVVSSEKKSLGTISGMVTIGPFCPLQRDGVPCPVPPDAYTSREVIVYAENGTTVQARTKLDTSGRYTIAIPPGRYFVQINPAGIGPGEKKSAVVTAAQTTVINFDIDTGIR